MADGGDGDGEVAATLGRAKVPDKKDDDDPGCILYVLMFLSASFVVLFFPITVWNVFKVVKQYERAMVYRLGRLNKKEAMKPGIHFVFPFLDELKVVDIRTRVIDVKPQELLTKDAMTVSIDAVFIMRVEEAKRSTFMSTDIIKFSAIKCKTMLRKIVGTLTIQQVIGDRKGVAVRVQKSLERQMKQRGIKLEHVGIKDIKLPQHLQRSMAAEAETERRARAKVIAADGEKKSSRALAAAGDMMGDSHAALQLRYLQTMGSVATNKKSTLIFPIPMQLGF